MSLFNTHWNHQETRRFPEITMKPDSVLFSRGTERENHTYDKFMNTKYSVQGNFLLGRPAQT